MKNTLDRFATGKVVLILFVLTNIVYVVMLSVTIPMTMEYANGMDLLDMMPSGYDSEYIASLFGQLGAEGRKTYLTRQIPLDLIYPGLFAICYSLMIAYFLKNLGRLRSSLFFLCFLPLIAGGADYLENFGIISMLNNYPDLDSSIASLTNTFTIVKSITTTVFFTVILVLLIMLGIKALRKES